MNYINKSRQADDVIDAPSGTDATPFSTIIVHQLCLALFLAGAAAGGSAIISVSSGASTPVTGGASISQTGSNQRAGGQVSMARYLIAIERAKERFEDLDIDQPRLPAEAARAASDTQLASSS